MVQEYDGVVYPNEFLFTLESLKNGDLKTKQERFTY